METKIIVTAIVAAVVALIVGVGLGILFGILIRKRVAEKKIGSAEEEAEKIKADAKMAATYETNRMIVAAQKDINQQRSDSEREIKERRAEITRSERRLASKEETLDRKTDSRVPCRTAEKAGGYCGSHYCRSEERVDGKP